MEAGGRLSGQAWKRFVSRHRRMTLLIVGGVAAAAAAALLVFVWVVAQTQAAGLVPSGLGDWTVGHVFTFVLNAILWELVPVGSWVIPLAMAAYFVWYRRLRAEERSEYEGGPRRRKSAGESGGFSFFVGVVWLIITWIEGRWNLPLRNWTLNEAVYSWIAASLVVLVIVGVPATIYIIWSLTREV